MGDGGTEKFPELEMVLSVAPERICYWVRVIRSVSSISGTLISRMFHGAHAMVLCTQSLCKCTSAGKVIACADNPESRRLVSELGNRSVPAELVCFSAGGKRVLLAQACLWAQQRVALPMQCLGAVPPAASTRCPSRSHACGHTCVCDTGNKELTPEAGLSRLGPVLAR